MCEPVCVYFFNSIFVFFCLFVCLLLTIVMLFMQACVSGQDVQGREGTQMPLVFFKDVD